MTFRQGSVVNFKLGGVERYSFMFGIPSDFKEAYLSAWKEPFHGVNLSWLELVIIKTAVSKKSVNEIREELASKYKIILDMNVSKFYRIVKRLVEDKYLRDEVEGREKIIQATDKGITEYGRLNRFIFMDQLDQVRQDLIAKFVQDLLSVTGDIVKKNVVVLAPTYSFILNLIQHIRNFKPDIDLSNNELTKQFHFINVNADTRFRNNYSSIWDSHISNWPLKEGFADLIILVTVFSGFEDRSFLKEIDRVLKSKGYLVIIEISASKQNEYETQFLQQITFLLNLSASSELSQENPWGLQMDSYLTPDRVKLEISEMRNLEIISTREDFINFQIIAQKIS